MISFRHWGIGARLAALVGIGAFIIVGLAAALTISHALFVQYSTRVQQFNQSIATLNHLDAREAELKVDAYRALIEGDHAALGQEVVTDLAMIDQALAQLRGYQLPQEFSSPLAQLANEVRAFSDFISRFISLAGSDPTVATRQQQEVARRNHQIDAQINDALQQLNSELDFQMAYLQQRKDQAWWLGAGCAAAGVGLMVMVAVPIGGSITRPLGQVGLVLSRLAQGDLTARVNSSASGEIAEMSHHLDEAIADMQRSVNAVILTAVRLADGVDRLATINGRVINSAHATVEHTQSSLLGAQTIQAMAHAISAEASHLSSALPAISASDSAALGVVTAAADATSTRAREMLEQVHWVSGHTESSLNALSEAVHLSVTLATEADALREAAATFTTA